MEIKEQNVSILTDSMKLKILEDEETKKEICNELNISENNKFKYRKNDKKFIDKMDMIIKQNPQRCFNLYKDLKSI